MEEPISDQVEPPEIQSQLPKTKQQLIVELMNKKRAKQRQNASKILNQLETSTIDSNFKQLYKTSNNNVNQFQHFQSDNLGLIPTNSQNTTQHHNSANVFVFNNTDITNETDNRFITNNAENRIHLDSFDQNLPTQQHEDTGKNNKLLSRSQCEPEDYTRLKIGSEKQKLVLASESFKTAKSTKIILTTSDNRNSNFQKLGGSIAVLMSINKFEHSYMHLLIPKYSTEEYFYRNRNIQKSGDNNSIDSTNKISMRNTKSIGTSQIIENNTGMQGFYNNNGDIRNIINTGPIEYKKTNAENQARLILFDNNRYNPNFIDDPDLDTGLIQRTMLGLTGLIGSIFQFSNNQSLESELNERFSEQHYELHRNGLTINRIRTTKASMLYVSKNMGLDLSTVALAYVYYEKLLVKLLNSYKESSFDQVFGEYSIDYICHICGSIPNSFDLFASICLLLAAKINEPTPTKIVHQLINNLAKRFFINKKHIYEHEFFIFSVLEFSLLVPNREYSPHIDRIT
ncbi:hypothetical protein BB559_005670 [Furculomyces boomerangus]|uniref:Uncharacterized protein n=1 Tax=Furculomyces boomerangus TaxID=61424 RepID=A0A2T9Y780_9FUNG|nr:hypothetical protein BB559_005670 [Furculomyces boomerangus]